MSLTSFDSKGWWAVAAWRWSGEQPRGDSPRPRSGAEATSRVPARQQGPHVQGQQAEDPTSRVPARQQALSEGIRGQTEKPQSQKTN